MDGLVLLSGTAPPCLAGGAGGAEVQAHPQVSEVEPVEKNRNTSLEEQEAKQTQPPRQRSRVQSRPEDKETSFPQQVHRSPALEKEAPPAGEAPRNRGSSSSGLRKTQSVQSLPTSTGQGDGESRRVS